MKKPARNPKLSPDAAKILEQYRNAGKAPSQNGEAAPGADGEGGSGPAKPAAPPPAPMRRSGTRGK